MNLFTSVLKNKLEQRIKNREEPQGFRQNRSTTNANVIIKQIKDKFMKIGAFDQL